METSDRNLNPELLVILGLCPILAKSTTLLSGITMGLAALVVLVLTITSVSSCRRYIPHKLGLVVILVVSVTWVSVLDMLLRAYWFDMSEQLGMYIPLLAMNSFVLLCLEQTALGNSTAVALTVTLRRGVGIFAIVSLLGGLRELFGSGKLFSDADILPGENYSQWHFADGGYALLMSAPGALLALGLLLAAYNHFTREPAA
jgi:electron transport complex protein RnfE